jgi:hypothetical protein
MVASSLLDVLALKSNRTKSLFGVLALTAFTAGFVWAYQEYPFALGEVKWTYVFLLWLALLPAVTLVNALRFYVTSRALGNRCTLRRAVTVTVFSTAANMLPIPGGMIVRAANLKGVNNNIKGAVSATLLTSAFSGLVTILLAAAAYLVVKESILSLIIFGGLTSVFVIALILMARGALKMILSKLVWIEVCSTLLDAARIVTCFAVIGLYISAERSLILTSASVVGSAISLVPAGLGVREITAALMAVHLSLIPSATYVAIGLNRLIGLSFFMMLTVPLSFYHKLGAEKVG